MLIALIALPLVIAFVLLVIGRTASRAPLFLTLGVVLTHLTVTVLLLIGYDLPIGYNVGGWGRLLGIFLLVDQLTLLTLFITGLVMLVAAMYSFGQGIVDTRFYALMLILMAGLSGWALTDDLFNMFVFIELSSVAAYALTAFERTRHGFEAAFKYVILGTLAGVFILAAILIVYFSTGFLNITLAMGELGNIPEITRLVFWGLMFLGLATKSGLVPVHMWLPDVHASATTPVSALLSGLVVKLGLLSLYRLMTLAQGSQAATYLPGILLLVGSLSIIVGHFLAWKQRDIKRFLAYSTVAHLGYIVMGLIAAPRATGAMLHIANHAFLKTTLFLSAGVLATAANSRQIDDFRGLGRRVPLVGAALTLAALGMVGIPPLNGFTSKWLIAKELLAAGWNPYVVALPLGTLISAVYYLDLLAIVWDKDCSREGRVKLNAFKSLALGVAGLGIVILTLAAPAIVSFLGGGV